MPFVSKVHPSRPSRTSVHGRLPRPALTNFCNNRRQESAPFVSKVRPGGPSRPSVHGPTPRPALVDFCNNWREESVPFVSEVHLSGPSRTSVTARSDELLKQTAPHMADTLVRSPPVTIPTVNDLIEISKFCSCYNTMNFQWKKGSVKWRCEHAQSRGFLGNFVNLHNATS